MYGSGKVRCASDRAVFDVCVCMCAHVCICVLGFWSRQSGALVICATPRAFNSIQCIHSTLQPTNPQKQGPLAWRNGDASVDVDLDMGIFTHNQVWCGIIKWGVDFIMYICPSIHIRPQKVHRPIEL